MASLRRTAALGLKAAACTLLVAAAALLLGPRLMGWQLQTVLSSSMAPAFEAGAVVAIEPAPASAIEVGDVVTFARPSGAPVTHRVVEVQAGDNSTMFVTKGDANEDVDPQPMPASAVIGKVRADVPHLGYFANFMRQPLGFLLLVLIPGGAFILAEMRALLMKQLGARQDQPTPA